MPDTDEGSTARVPARCWLLGLAFFLGPSLDPCAGRCVLPVAPVSGRQAEIVASKNSPAPAPIAGNHTPPWYRTAGIDAAGIRLDPHTWPRRAADLCGLSDARFQRIADGIRENGASEMLDWRAFRAGDSRANRAAHAFRSSNCAIPDADKFDVFRTRLVPVLALTPPHFPAHDNSLPLLPSDSGAGEMGSLVPLSAPPAGARPFPLE